MRVALTVWLIGLGCALLSLSIAASGTPSAWWVWALAAYGLAGNSIGIYVYLRARRYVYGENAPIPTKDFGQRARTARPDGGTKP